MACPHRQFGTCNNCQARYEADDDFLYSQDRLARRREADREDRSRREWERRENARSARRDFDLRQQQIAANMAAKKAATAAARARQPFNLFWYERLAVVGIAVMGVLTLLASLPSWLLLLVLAGVGVLVWRFRFGPFRRVTAFAGRFIRGDRRPPTAATGP